MKIAIIGGNGGLGGHAATYLAGMGHDTTIASRNRPIDGTPMAKMPFLQGDYVKEDFTPERLKGFDAIIFTAGADPRHVPKGAESLEYLESANSKGIPAFVRAARVAGVKRFIQVGSFYHQAEPELEANNGYVRTRRLADEGARAEARPGFDVLTINPPVMVGAVPGAPSMIFEPVVAWVEGRLPLPLTVPPGGTNFMSFLSLSQAIEGALLRGESGRAYLVGDENLTYAEYFSLFFEAAGKSVRLDVNNEEHPIMVDAAILQGRGNTISYEPDPTETALLGYQRNDIRRAAAEVIKEFAEARRY